MPTSLSAMFQGLQIQADHFERFNFETSLERAKQGIYMLGMRGSCSALSDDIDKAVSVAIWALTEFPAAAAAAAADPAPAAEAAAAAPPAQHCSML